MFKSVQQRCKRAFGLLGLLMLLSPFAFAADGPIQHKQVADITDKAEAKKVFQESTEALKKQEKLTPEAMHEIHMITYSLEKSVAYFAENTKGKSQMLANKMVDVVENIHLNSETNEVEKTQAALDTYYPLAEKLMGLWKLAPSF